MELGKKTFTNDISRVESSKKKEKKKKNFLSDSSLSSHDSDPCQNHDNRSATFLAYSTLQRNSVQLEKYQIFHHYNPEKILLGHRIEEKPKEKERLKSYLPRVIGSQYRTQDVHLVNRFL